MSKRYIALQLHNGEISVAGGEQKVRLPDKCVGILFVFKTKTAARKYWVRNVKLIELESEAKE